ncbi:MAG: nucleotidyltransferase family protein, partial [Prochlorococcaceae cyanobacterium]
RTGTDQTGAMTSSALQPALGSDQILALLRARRSEWQQRYQLQRIGLYSFGEAFGYGSIARNQATADSDVDVWVELDPLTPFATVHLKQELEELLQRPVDLVRLRERMNPALRQAILQEGISA